MPYINKLATIFANYNNEPPPPFANYRLNVMQGFPREFSFLEECVQDRAGELL